VTTAGATADTEVFSNRLTPTRWILGYVVVFGLLAVAIGISFGIGRSHHPEPAIGGFYTSSSTCLGSTFKLSQSGQFVDLGEGVSGKLRLQHGHLKGTVNCASGGSEKADPHALATDISLALWATGAGLLIANPMMLIGNDVHARLRRLRDRTERQLQDVLEMLEPNQV
jgi:hypothetical protein